MVTIKDMEMPSRCMNCELLGKEEMYCSKYPRRDLNIIDVATNRPYWCPLVEIQDSKLEKIEKIEQIAKRDYCFTDEYYKAFKEIRNILEQE